MVHQDQIGQVPVERAGDGLNDKVLNERLKTQIVTNFAADMVAYEVPLASVQTIGEKFVHINRGTQSQELSFV